MHQKATSTSALATDRPRILFMGTAKFAVPSLHALASGKYAPIAVVTGPDRRSGRGQRYRYSPVKEAAVKLGIDAIHQPESLSDPTFVATMAAYQPHIIAVVAFRILPREVYTLASRGAFNLHASLLPSYRGAAPINRAVMAGETETGVTTFYLEDRVDTGSIILKRELPIGPNDTAGIVHDRLKETGADLVLATADAIWNGRAPGQSQHESTASAAPKIFPSDCLIPWDEPSTVIHNHCRGLSPYPGAWSCLRSSTIKVLKTELGEGTGPPGTVLCASRGTLSVACGDGAVVIRQLQKEGKRRLGTAAFLNGFPIKVGERFK